MTTLIVQVVCNLKGLRGAMLAAYAGHIYTSLNGNTNFTGIFPAPSVLNSAITALNLAVSNQVKGVKTTTDAVKHAEALVKRILKVLAANVEYISNNNSVIALSSGFSIKSHTTKTLNDFNAIHGLLTGTVDVKSKAFTDGSYIFQYTQTPLNEASWVTSATSKQVKHTITGLTAGVMYWFRVSVVIKTGQQPPSTPINLMVV
jgi:hypothetical protein